METLAKATVEHHAILQPEQQAAIDRIPKVEEAQ